MSPGIDEWFAARIPEQWKAQGLEIVADQDEILVLVDLPSAAAEVDQSPGEDPADPADATDPAGPINPADPADPADAADPKDLTGVRLFREGTRDERMALAGAAEQMFGRKVSWGARCGGVVVIFTTASVPVMTRLRLPERRVLDTLIDAGVARSRSDALAWCVRLVGDNEKAWISELRTAFQAVETARDRGPRARRGRAPEGGQGPGG